MVLSYVMTYSYDKSINTVCTVQYTDDINTVCSTQTTCPTVENIFVFKVYTLYSVQYVLRCILYIYVDRVYGQYGKTPVQPIKLQS